MKKDYLNTVRTDTIGSNPQEFTNTWELGIDSFYQNKSATAIFALDIWYGV